MIPLRKKSFCFLQGNNKAVYNLLCPESPFDHLCSTQIYPPIEKAHHVIECGPEQKVRDAKYTKSEISK